MALLIVSFVAGVLTVLAPCILPLLPIILAGTASETTNRRRPLVIIGSLSVSVLVFTLLLKGSTALLSIPPSVWAYISGGILTIFGLTLIFPEVWARIVLKIPGHNKPDRWIAKGYDGKGSFWTDVTVGAALGPVFTTCSPTFFVILATVLPQSFAIGLVYLIAYVVGLALSLLVIAWVGSKIVDKLGWATDPHGWFRKILGAVFIAIAILIATGADKKLGVVILDAGFLDVTRFEQRISEFLERDEPSPFMDDQTAPTSPISTTSSAAYEKLAPGAVKRQGQYVELVNIAGYINTLPVKLADLVGKKVILVDFVDYSCINCQRTFPYMNDWYKKYRDQGLEIVAIHTPEFEFERDIENVRAAAARFGLKFPIVLDNDYSTWNAYRNRYWPHKYLIDIRGDIVYDHIGEGKYDETERVIVDLLNERKQVLGEPGAVRLGELMPTYTIQSASPETYFGAERNDNLGNGRIGTPGESAFALPTELMPNKSYLDGTWDIDLQYAESKTASAAVSFVFKAAKMYMVATTATGKPITARVLIDGKEIRAAVSGADVQGGVLTITDLPIYNLYATDAASEHRIDIIFSEPGAQVYTFTFG